jgi:hypothetical protein
MADHGEFREEFADEHPHSYDHTEPKGSLLFILLGVTVILLLFTAIGIQYYYETLRENEVYDRVLAPSNIQLVDLRNKEDQELHSYGYVDKNAGKVRVPIERAMTLVTQEARSGQMKWPTASYKIRTPEELAAQAATPVSQPGATAADNAQAQGTGSSPETQVNPKK